MDEILKEEMKQEAIRRMKLLDLLPSVVEKFDKEDIVYYSENMGGNLSGILFYLHNNPEWLQQVKNFEKKTGHLVYHTVLTHFTFGDILDLLYVREEKEEWKDEQEELKQGYADIYAINLTDDRLSEYGSAMYKSINGGVIKLQ